MRTCLFLAFVGFLAVDANAQSDSGRVPTVIDATQPSRVPVKRLALSDERYSRLYFDVDAAGATWVRGRAYKARFDASGATLFPFMGSDAPRHYPVAMSLESATVAGVAIAIAPGTGAVRDGDDVTVDRGPIDEVYELGVDEIEQTFVIESLPASGELVLRVRVETELSKSETGAGFRFGNERGHVSYGRASVRGATGLIAVPTSLLDGAVEIRVPASVVAQNGLPLVVDPVISVFVVDAYHDQFAPDVAYDHAHDVYLEIEEERFTAADSDSYSVRLSATGAFTGANYADITTADWRAPRVANLNVYDQFMVVASIDDDVTAGGQRFIGGRQTPASAIAFGPVIPISDTGFVLGDMYNVDVGGDPHPLGPSHYCVAWQWDTVFFPQTKEIHYRLVTNVGTTAGPSTVLTTVTGTVDEVPSVSTGNGGTFWTIAWQRRPVSTQHYTIWAARVEWTGSLTNPAFLVASGGNRFYGPSAASPMTGDISAIAYLEDWVSDRDVRVAVGSPVGGFVHTNISNLDVGSYLEDQYSASIDSNGSTLALVFAESPDGSGTQPSDIFVCNLYRETSGASTLGVIENRAVIETGAPHATAPRICTALGASGNPSMVVFEQSPTIGASRTVMGALYRGMSEGDILSVCAGDGSATACPCGNTGAAGHGCGNSGNASGALLAGSGWAHVNLDQVVLTASGMPATASCLFFQGTTIPGGGTGAMFGDGLRCAGGTVVRLAIATASGGSSTYPGPGDPPVSVKGMVPAQVGLRIYQVWYRNSAEFCSPALFNLTNAVKILWAP